MTSSAQSHVRSLETGLAAARAKVRAAAVRRTLAAAAERVAFVALGTGATALTAVTLCRLTGSAAVWPAYAVIGVGVLAAAGVVGRAMATLREEAVDDVAERFDLAAADHNAVATALDFARAGDNSPMARRAIDGGLTVLQARANAVEPVTPAARVRPVRTAGPLVGGIALLAVALLLPAGLLATRHDLASVDPAAVALAPLTPPSSAARKPADPPAGPKAAAPAAPEAAPQKSSPAKPAVTPATNQPGAAVAAGSGEAPSASPSMEASATPPTQKPGKPAGNPGEAVRPQEEAQSPSAPKAAGSEQKVAAGADSPDGSPKPSGKTAAANAPGDSPAGDQDGQKSGDQKSSNPGNQDGPPDAPPGEKGDSQGGQDGADDQPGDQPGSGNGKSDASTDQGGGNGQSSGQSPPKKARGVAPLMLGSRQADLIQGRPLPGPDERTRLQLPPVPQPLDPAAASRTQARRAPEPATGVYRVPADQRAAVDSYFKRFHQDPAAK